VGIPFKKGRGRSETIGISLSAIFNLGIDSGAPSMFVREHFWLYG
jgi:hypothetical protein